VRPDPTIALPCTMQEYDEGDLEFLKKKKEVTGAADGA
jgi:hypothetical protein